MPEISTAQKYARIFRLPEEDIAHTDYNIITNILTVTYGIDQPRYKQKRFATGATKEFADFFTAPIFIGKSVDYILTAYLKEKSNTTPTHTYYTSTDPFFGKMTLNRFIETEVKERGNYTLADVQNWMRKYNISMNDLGIWVSPKKWVANRYNLLAEEWDEAKKIPESEMNVYEIKDNEGFIIPESDDGDEGYLFMFKRNMNHVIREGTATGQHDKVKEIIEDVKKKPISAPEKRDEIRRGLTALADSIDRSAITELRSFRPLGMMSEFGAAMGAEPRKGARIDTPYGPYVFDEKRLPSKDKVDRWGKLHKEAEGIRVLAAEYAFGLGVIPNTVTGNFRVVEHARRIRAEGMLSPEEVQVLNALEKYWEAHPELDRQKGYGIWGHNLEIMVPESLRKNMTEKKGSLIDALLKIEPGKDIRIDYKDIPKGAERIIHLPTDNLSQPTNLTGLVLERKGDLIVVAIYADNVITAHIFLQKGSQLIQIRPIPRQKTPIKGGEATTIYYTNWVERIKKEAPEYLPEWEIFTQAGIRAGDTIIHKTAKYTAVVEKIYKNGNADITVLEAKGIPEWEKSIKEGFPIKTTVKGADIDRYFEKAAINGTEAKQPWQMTRSEAIAEAAKPLGPMGISWGEMRTALSTSRQSAESLHKDMVKLAIVERKPVPAEVLNEYHRGTSMYPIPGVSTTPKVFTYFFRNRPPDIGTFPKGAVMKEAWIPKRATEKGNMAWGWASYERELTPDELYNYELFVDEIVMPKLVKELIKFTHDEGILEGFKELKSKTGWSEYGLAFRDWLKANNEWKPDKGEEAEFLRHLARLTGKTPPETKLEDQEKAKLFLSALSRFTLDELIQQEATVRRWSIRFPQMEKELEDEYKMYLELRRAEKATAEEARKEKASKPQSDQAKELYKQMRKTNSVRELDDWRNKVLFEAHLPDVEEDILLRDLAAKWRIYLETRGIPALNAFDKLPLDYTNEDYYFGTEVYVHPTTGIFEDQPYKGIIHEARNGGELWEVVRAGSETEGTSRVPIGRLYVKKIVEKTEPRYQPPIKAVTSTERPAFNPEQAIKIAADSIEQLRRVDVFRVLDEYSNKSKELGDYIKSKRPDLVTEVDKILGVPQPQPKDKFAEIQDQMQRDKEKITAEYLYKRYTSGYSAVSLLGIVRQESKDLAHSIGFELKLNTATYTPAVLLRIAEKFKEFAQRDFDIDHEKHEKKRLKEQAEKEMERQQGGQAFWDEVKNLKVVDYEVQHDINPDKPTRTYYHVYDRTFAILENGKQVQISYEINKGEHGKRAAKATKEYYRKFYDQYMGKPLSEWVTEYQENFIRINMQNYKTQQPKPRFTFIPEAPVVLAPPTLPVAKVQSTQDIMQQVLNSIQTAKNIDELKQVLKGIGFLPLGEADKRQLMDAYQNRFTALQGEILFGTPIKTEGGPRLLGAPSRQEIAEKEARRRAEEGKKLKGQVSLSGAVSTSRRLEEWGIKESMNELSPTMRQYIQGATGIGPVIYRGSGIPLRGELFRASDKTYFVHAQDNQIYASMGWERV